MFWTTTPFLSPVEGRDRANMVSRAEVPEGVASCCAQVCVWGGRYWKSRLKKVKYHPLPLPVPLPQKGERNVFPVTAYRHLHLHLTIDDRVGPSDI